MIAGSRVGGLTYFHLHLYPHMTNPTNRCSFPYLANFMAAVVGLALSNFAAFCSMIYILHSKLCDLQFHRDSSKSQASLYQGSQMFQSICRYDRRSFLYLAKFFHLFHDIHLAPKKFSDLQFHHGLLQLASFTLPEFIKKFKPFMAIFHPRHNRALPNAH
jgi:hypothetical protein